MFRRISVEASEAGPAENRAVFDSVAETYTDLSLAPAERTVMRRLGRLLPDLEMLDLGVGSGRTGYTFAALVHRYVGVDYSERMIERARRLLGEDEATTLQIGDARDLSSIEGRFGFVLFSFNGIDAVGHEDRLKILAEVRRVIEPDGHFLFSAHSLGALPLATKKQRSERFAGSRAYAAYAGLRDVSYGRRIREINASLDLAAARERGWVVVPSIGHNFRIDDYYVDPEFQVTQLGDVGFEVISVYDVAGAEVELPHRGRDPWLNYLCRPTGATA